MEYCRHGDLHHYLRRVGSVPAEGAQQLAYQILEGLDQMHHNDFAHRDLKPGVRITLVYSEYLLMLSEHSY
jgi:serine/threonine protein kinase